MDQSGTIIEVTIDDKYLANYLVGSLRDNDAWYSEDNFVSYDFYSIDTRGDVFFIESDAPIEFTITEWEEPIGLRFDMPRQLTDVVPFLKKLNDWYLKVKEEEEGTVFFDLLIEQLEVLSSGVGPITIVYEELDGYEDVEGFRAEFTFSDNHANYSESI